MIKLWKLLLKLILGEKEEEERLFCMCFFEDGVIIHDIWKPKPIPVAVVKIILCSNKQVNTMYGCGTRIIDKFNPNR